MFTRHLVYLSAFFLLISFSKNIYAQTFSLPSISSTGIYTITYSTPLTFVLIDELVSGAWRTIGGGQKSGSFSITKVASGTYTYRMQNCTANQSGSSCSIVSGNKSIVVTINDSSSSCAGGGNAITYCYDDLGRIKTVIYPNGVKNNYEYDAVDNRIKKESTTN